MMISHKDSLKPKSKANNDGKCQIVCFHSYSHCLLLVSVISCGFWCRTFDVSSMEGWHTKHDTLQEWQASCPVLGSLTVLPGKLEVSYCKLDSKEAVQLKDVFPVLVVSYPSSITFRASMPILK
ncbi:hypothetical protein PoB_000099200 [Plakobranchus ocellatus]|uniref:Uncharacterized protein n=1 Tax=Plakobranchus ocellatus TaxID=259542 RepID=A0AAV3XWH1_9GAST|nr:hypothetical protein PoB_000099200 [Plakobranchus ocellatus]